MIAEGDRVALPWTVSGVLTRQYYEFGDRPDNVVGSAGDHDPAQHPEFLLSPFANASGACSADFTEYG